MKTLLVLASALGIAYAGVQQLAPGEESQILSLYEQICNGGGGYGGGYGGGSGEGQSIGGALIYCKSASGSNRQSLDHRVTVPGSRGKDQIVFVRPAPAHYDHNILVDSGSSKGGKTKIYVLPQKATHNVQTQVNPGSSSAEKPTVYFLNGDSGSSSTRSFAPPSSSYGAPEIRIPPSQSYGAPEIRTPPSSSYGAPEVRIPTSGYGAPARLHKRSDYISYPVQVEFKNL